MLSRWRVGGCCAGDHYSQPVRGNPPRPQGPCDRAQPQHRGRGAVDPRRRGRARGPDQGGLPVALHRQGCWRRGSRGRAWEGQPRAAGSCVIILDTNVISEPLRPRPGPGVVAWLDAQAVETLYLTTISLAEVRYSIACLPRGARRNKLHDRFEADFLPLFHGRTLAFNEPAAAAYAALRA